MFIGYGKTFNFLKNKLFKNNNFVDSNFYTNKLGNGFNNHVFHLIETQPQRFSLGKYSINV